jgi:hypothetical protein
VGSCFKVDPSLARDLHRTGWRSANLWLMIAKECLLSDTVLGQEGCRVQGRLRPEGLQSDVCEDILLLVV